MGFLTRRRRGAQRDAEDTDDCLRLWFQLRAGLSGRGHLRYTHRITHKAEGSIWATSSTTFI